MIIDNLELKNLIKKLCEAMRADFGNQYAKQFANDKDLAMYQRRVYQKFDGTNLDDLADGYEWYVDDHHKFPPNLSQLIEYVEKAESKRKADQRLQDQIASNTMRIEHKPAIECDPVQMLATATQSVKILDAELTAEERAKRLADLMQNHRSILTIHRQHLRRPRYDHDLYRCAYSGCGQLGALSDSTRGEGPWYCAEHNRMV